MLRREIRQGRGPFSQMKTLKVWSEGDCRSAGRGGSCRKAGGKQRGLDQEPWLAT